ncbi:hypothetical protein Ahia01_000027600 [Argonauta hians]
MALQNMNRFYYILYGFGITWLLNYSRAQTSLPRIYAVNEPTQSLSEDTLCRRDSGAERSVCNMNCSVNFDKKRFPQKIVEHTCVLPAPNQFHKCSEPVSNNYGCEQVKTTIKVLRAHNCNDIIEYREEDYEYNSGCVCSIFV